jgi:hypothetical protein
MGAFTRIKVGRSRKLITKYSSVYLLKRGGRKTIKIGFDSNTLRKLRSGLTRRQRITATVWGAILDPSGNIESQTRGKELRVRG